MQFPVLSRYFLLADKVKVIAALMTVLHPIKKPPLPAQFPALPHSVSILAGTVLFPTPLGGGRHQFYSGSFL